MKKLSGVLMILGVALSLIFYLSSIQVGQSAPQDIELISVSLATMIGFYVLGRALENFSNTDNSNTDNNE